ncbi:MAG: DUF3137 domain-containing protein [Cyanobacteria bacterium P01_A01_bin.135]
MAQVIQPKSTAEFEQYYKRTLYWELQALEKLRRATLIKLIPATLVIGLLTWGIVALLAKPWYAVTVGPLLWQLVCVQAIVRPYKSQFKARIISEVLTFIDPSGSFHYTQNPAGQPNRFPFIESRLFGQRKPYYFSEVDSFAGAVGKAQVYFSHIRAGRRLIPLRRHAIAVFTGFFFQANFNKSFFGHTVIVTNVSENQFGTVRQALQSIGRPQASRLIKFEGLEFNRYFTVYSSDEREARYIISPHLVQHLIKFQHKIGKDIRIAFLDDNIYVAIPHPRRLFEPQLLRSIVAFQPALECFETLQIMIGLVDDLQLNQPASHRAN